MKKYIYGASVHAIQEYIFTTNELKSIVGASNIIKNINTFIEQNYKNHIIINAAGNVKLIFNKKEEFEDLVKNFLKQTRQNAYGLKISQAVVSFESGNLKSALNELESKLYIQRNKPQLPLDTTINIIKNTKKTAKPMVEDGKDKATKQKEIANATSANMPKNAKNKTAIIHADGNSLGAMIASMSAKLKTDEEVLKAYKTFSTNLQLATQKAFDIAKDGIKNIREIILGGDDVTVICNADDALSFSESFLVAFEKQTKEVFKNDGLTACVGIAFANYKYPFHYALSLAESLCSYAKTHSKEIMQKQNLSLAPSSLMFHNIQSSNFIDFDNYIEKELTLTNDKETIHLNYGPYFVDEQKGYATITSFKHLSHALMLKESPMSRYREWLTILGKNSTQAKERMQRIDTMLELKNEVYRKKSLVNAINNFNKDLKTDEMLLKRGEKLFTPIQDIDTYLSVVKGDNYEV